MAKVSAPLFSLEARGKIADAMVFFPWKGRHVVRQWLKPSNPKTANQGNARLVLGGLGRACKSVHKASQYAVDTRVVAGSGQTWVSAFVKYCVDTWMSDGPAFEAKWAEATGHAAWIHFHQAAVALGMITFDVTYKGTANQFIEGLQLYMLACFGCAQYTLNNDHFNREPFLDTIGSWVQADVTALVALLPSL